MFAITLAYICITLKARIFVIEYPIYISDLVADYTNCLRSQNVDIGPGRTFEAEHRNAVPLCAKKEQRNKKEAFELLSSRPKSSMTMEQLGNLFDNIKVTHIDRGRVMDGFMDRGFDADPYAKQVGKAQEPPVDLATPSVGA